MSKFEAIPLSAGAGLVLSALVHESFGNDVEIGMRSIMAAYILTYSMPENEFNALMDRFGQTISAEIDRLRHLGEAMLDEVGLDPEEVLH